MRTQTPTLDEIIDATMPKREADALRKRYWDGEYERVSMSLSRPPNNNPDFDEFEG